MYKIVPENKRLFGLSDIEKFDYLSKTSHIKTPKDLLMFMRDFEYGWVHNRRHYNQNNDPNMDHYHVMQPYEVFNYKKGVCQDQSLFEYDILVRLRFECKLYFIHQFYTSTHTYCMFKQGSRWYHFENSFAMFRGISGSYINPDDSIKYVYNNMEKYKPCGKGYLGHEIDPSKFFGRFDIDVNEMLIISGFDFNRS